MKIDEIKEAAIRYLLEKGIITDENSVNDSETVERIHVARANILTTLVNSGARISPNNFQRFVIEYDEDLQYATDYKVYYVPNFINGMIDYVGNSQEKYKLTIVTNISDLTDTIKDRIWKKVRGLLVMNEFRVYDKNYESDLTFFALVENPMDIVSFNPDLDEYPLDASLMPLLFENLFKTYYQYIVGKKPDKTSDNIEA